MRKSLSEHEGKPVLIQLGYQLVQEIDYCCSLLGAAVRGEENQKVRGNHNFLLPSCKSGTAGGHARHAHRKHDTGD